MHCNKSYVTMVSNYLMVRWDGMKFHCATQNRLCFKMYELFL